MFQRIQTVYLFLATVFSGLFLGGSFASFGNQGIPAIKMKFNGIFRLNAENNLVASEQMIPVTIISVIIPVITFAIILIYKNRKLQMKLIIGIIILEILLVAAACFYIISVIRNEGMAMGLGFQSIMPFPAVLFLILAYRGIKKDEDLVRSYDRLR